MATSRITRKQALRLLPRIVAEVSSEPADVWRASPGRRRVETTTTGTVVTIIPERDRSLVVKIARTPMAAAGLCRNADVVHALRKEDRLRDWAVVLPAVVARGEIEGVTYIVEEALNGVSGMSAAGTATRGRRLAAARAISELHERTEEAIRVDEEIVNRWVVAPIDRLRAVAGDPGGFARVRDELTDVLLRTAARVGWIHGDFWLGNVLFDPTSASVMGILDWEWAAEHELAAHDLLHLLLYSRRTDGRRELGRIIRDLLTNDGWTEDERTLLDRTGMHPDDPRAIRPLLLLYWIRHAASHVAQSPGDLRRRVWVRRNITPVLDLFSAG